MANEFFTAQKTLRSGVPLLLISLMFLAGCAACDVGPQRVGGTVGVGTDGVRGGVSVSNQCGPVHINVGAGRGYGWYGY